MEGSVTAAWPAAAPPSRRNALLRAPFQSPLLEWYLAKVLAVFPSHCTHHLVIPSIVISMATPVTVSFSQPKCFDHLFFFEKGEIHVRSSAMHGKSLPLARQNDTPAEAATATVTLHPSRSDGSDGVGAEDGVSSRRGGRERLGHPLMRMKKRWVQTLVLLKRGRVRGTCALPVVSTSVVPTAKASPGREAC